MEDMEVDMVTVHPSKSRVEVSMARSTSLNMARKEAKDTKRNILGTKRRKEIIIR